MKFILFFELVWNVLVIPNETKRNSQPWINQYASSFLKGTIALHRPPMTPFLYLNVRICVSNSTNPCEEAKCGKNVRGE
jgi:hypothetical protein